MPCTITMGLLCQGQHGPDASNSLEDGLDTGELHGYMSAAWQLCLGRGGSSGDANPGSQVAHAASLAGWFWTASGMAADDDCAGLCAREIECVGTFGQGQTGGGRWHRGYCAQLNTRLTNSAQNTQAAASIIRSTYTQKSGVPRRWGWGRVQNRAPGNGVSASDGTSRPKKRRWEGCGRADLHVRVL